jgi:hypothetical protein
MPTLLRTEPEVVVGPEPLAPRVVGVEAVGGATTVHVTFETGETRDVDLGALLTRGVFRALTDPAAFVRVRVVDGGGGVEWDSGADLSANRLYFGAAGSR